MTTIEEIGLAYAFYVAIQDWEKYGDTSTMLEFISKYGVRLGTEADDLTALML